MSTESCSVTVQSPRARVDLTLPATTPIVEFVPTIARLCRADRPDGLPPAWSLARVGAAPLDLGASLADGGVLDGEVLHLVDVARWRSPVVVDLEDAVAGVVETDGARERLRLRAVVVAGLGVAFVLAAAVVGAFATSGGVAVGAVAALAAAGLLGLAALVRARLGQHPMVSGLAAGGWALAWLAGWAVAGGSTVAAGLAAAAGGVMVAASSSLPVTTEAAACVTVVAGTLAIASGAVAAGAMAAQAAAAVVALGVLAVRVLPSLVSRRLVGEVAGQERDAVEASTRRHRRLLRALSLGVLVSTVSGAAVLVAVGGGFALALAATAALALLLRAWSYRYLAEALPALAAAGIVLLMAEAAVAWRVGVANGHAAAGVLLLGMTGTVLAAASGGRGPSDELSARADRLWLLVDLALPPLALATMGAFAAAARLAQHLVG